MDLGRILLFGGLFLIAVGAVLVRWPNLFSWFGRLPGDFRVQGDKVSFVFPLTSMIIVSVLFTIGINLMARLLSWK
jgi:hypothetical protein